VLTLAMLSRQEKKQRNTCNNEDIDICRWSEYVFGMTKEKNEVITTVENVPMFHTAR
jgi:hypothetical protein